MKKITIEQIEVVLREVYGTNISAQRFDALKQFFSQLPNCEEKGLEKKK